MAKEIIRNTKKDMIDGIAKISGLKKGDIDKMIDAMKEFTIAALKNGEEVSLQGLVTFKTYTRKETTRRNPKTNEIVNVPAKKALKAVFGTTVKSEIE